MRLLAAITSLVVALTFAAGCGDDSDIDTGHSDQVETTVDAMIVHSGIDLDEVCAEIELAEAYDSELAFEAFADGFQDAGEPIGLTARQVYDELRSRC